LIEIFVPTTDGPQVWGKTGAPIDLPRHIITAHEAFGHGTCGSGLCAVAIENKIRKSLGLEQRSGSDHEFVRGEQRPRGSQIPPTQVTVSDATPALIPSPAPPVPTFVVPKALRKPNN